MKTRQTNGTAETSKTYTKKDLVIKIAEETGLPQLAAGELVQQVLDGICAALADGYRVEFRDFGVFRRIKRKPRIGRNPKNPAGEVKIPSCETIRFKPGRIMRCICGKEK
ncbi:MAG: integration host factor subunit beta [Kiritimatiellae bacterium]|nr:integration host factor subunit beta [Kiritimatiellia bacterium]